MSPLERRDTNRRETIGTKKDLRDRVIINVGGKLFEPYISTLIQSLISKVTKKRLGFNLKIFVFTLLKTVHCRAERN